MVKFHQYTYGLELWWRMTTSLWWPYCAKPIKPLNTTDCLEHCEWRYMHHVRQRVPRNCRRPQWLLWGWPTHHQSSFETIQLRIHFARLRSSDLLITDNGPNQPLLEWLFTQRTSSPHYLRSDGQAEAAVEVAKSIMSICQKDITDVDEAIFALSERS